MLRLTYSMLLLTILALVAGCSGKTEETAEKTPSTPAADTGSGEEGHSHGEGPNGQGDCTLSCYPSRTFSR